MPEGSFRDDWQDRFKARLVHGLLSRPKLWAVLSSV